MAGTAGDLEIGIGISSCKPEAHAPKANAKGAEVEAEAEAPDNNSPTTSQIILITPRGHLSSCCLKAYSLSASLKALIICVGSNHEI